jgi:hypothetical protein
MATRRQDEAERSAGVSEEADALLQRVKDFDDILGLLRSGATGAAVARGELSGIDVGGISPQDFQQQHEAAKAKAAARNPVADEHGLGDGGLPGEPKEWSYAADGLPVEWAEKALKAAQHAAEESKRGGGDEGAQGEAYMEAREGVEAEYAAPVNEAHQEAWETRKAEMGERAAAAQHEARQQAVSPGTQQAMGAPPQQAMVTAQQPRPTPQQSQMAMQQAMGAPPQARPQPQQRPQQQQAPQSLAARDAAMQAPVTGVMMGGLRVDPIARQRELLAYQAAQQRQMARQVRDEKIARAAAPVQRALLKQSQSPALSAAEKETYEDFAESFPEILEAYDGDVDKALKMMSAGEGLKTVLDRQLKRDLKKKRGGGGGGGGGRSRKGLSKEWDRGYQMVEKRLSRQQFDFQGANNSTRNLEGAMADIASDNPTRQKKGLKFLAKSREGGKVTDRDMLDLLGDQNLWDTVDTQLDRWSQGGLGKEIQNQLVSTMRIGVTRGRKKMGKIRQHAELVYGSAESRGGDFGLGARAFITESFGEGDEMVDMDQEAGGRSRRRESAAEPEVAEPSSGLGAQYGY